MSYKILEANGVDNENIDGGALNNLIVKDKNGIVNGVLSECALTATGSLIGISPGLLILHGIRVKITATETLTLANVPATATKYQIVAQVVLSTDRSVSFSFLVKEPIALKQDELYATNEGTYQIEFGTFTQNTDGTISSLVRTVRTLYESETQMREDLNGALSDIATLKTDVDGNEKGIAENVALIANNARNIAQNSAHIQNLFSIARANNQFAVLKTEQAYTTRETANGAEIFDDQYTAVTEIKGSTVRCENLFDKSKISSADFANCTDTSISEDKNVLIATGNEGGDVADFSYPTGWVRSLYIEVGNGGGASCEAGDTVTVSADITLITQGSRAAAVRCYIYREDNTGVTSGWEKTISATKKRVSWSFSVSKTGRYYPIFAINSNRVRIENIKMSKDGSTEYQPYFSDLKHANISAIKSTGRNLINYYGDADSYGRKFTVSYGGVDEIGKDYVIAHGVLSHVGESNWYNSAHSNGWLQRYLSQPIQLYAGKTYTVSFDITLLETISGKTSFKAAVYGFTSSNGVEYTLHNTLDTQRIKLTRTLSNNREIRSGSLQLSLNSLKVKISNFMIVEGDTAPIYEPYTEEIYQLPQELINLYPNGIPEYDRFYPQTGEIIRSTGYATSETGFTEEEIAGYDGAIVSSDKLSLEYKLATPTIEKIENAPKLYKAWNKGRESVIQGEIDNSIYGAMPTITNEYFTAVGAGEEEANE